MPGPLRLRISANWIFSFPFRSKAKRPSRIAINSYQLCKGNRVSARRNSQVPERVVALIDLSGRVEIQPGTSPST